MTVFSGSDDTAGIPVGPATGRYPAPLHILRESGAGNGVPIATVRERATKVLHNAGTETPLTVGRSVPRLQFQQQKPPVHSTESERRSPGRAEGQTPNTGATPVHGRSGATSSGQEPVSSCDEADAQEDTNKQPAPAADVQHVEVVHRPRQCKAI